MIYSQIKLNDIANTDSGINTSLWTQGCPHHCKGCFNKETWGFNLGKEFTEESYQYICDNIDKYGIHRNLSILGGEPLCPENIDGVVDLCKKFKQDYPNKKVYIWTGYTYESMSESQRRVLPCIDLLVDGKFEESKKDLGLKLRGSSNQRVINVKESLKQNKIISYNC